MDYKSARLIGASGLLKKNKGVMLVGNGTTILGLNGLSGGNWVNSQATIVIPSTPQNPVVVVPVMVYGITLGNSAAFELN
jgi:hypothetical protein